MTTPITPHTTIRARKVLVYIIARYFAFFIFMFVTDGFTMGLVASQKIPLLTYTWRVLVFPLLIDGMFIYPFFFALRSRMHHIISELLFIALFALEFLFFAFLFVDPYIKILISVLMFILFFWKRLFKE